MLLIAVLALACVVGAADIFECATDGGSNLYPFQRHPKWKIKMNFPCKYWALKDQKCGHYKINLSPGNKWYYPFYQLDTMWLDVSKENGNKSWQGRTTNKKAAKYVNAKNKSNAVLFTKKGGNMNTDDLFTTNAEWGAGASVESKDGMFKVTFYPWDPMNRQTYPKSFWKFECHDPDMPDNEYPNQMCGGSNFKRVLRQMTADLGLKERFHPITHYYTNFFVNENIVQIDEQCLLAVSNLQQRRCGNNNTEQHIKVLANCAPMLYNTKRTKCLSFYNCDPMEAYNSCLKWGCKEDFNPKEADGKTPSTLCAALSENIYFCPKIAGPGNLSDRAYGANCYKGFVPIEPPADEDAVFPPIIDDDWGW